MKTVTIGHQIVPESSIKQERDVTNYYPTPVPFLNWMWAYLEKNSYLPNLYSDHFSGLDIGTGTGNWGKTLHSRYGVRIDGVEKYPNRFKDTKFGQEYRYLFHMDAVNIRERYSFVCGNPPYTRGNRKKGEPSTNQIVQYALNNIVTNDGMVIFLLPTAFRHGVWRKNNLPVPYAVIDLANRINFQSENGKGGSYPGEYCLMIWNKAVEKNYYMGYRVIWE